MKWAVFLSGRGSNAEAFFEMSDLDIRLCVSSKKNALGLVRARRNGISTLILDKNPDWSGLSRELQVRQITHLFLLGFMKLLPGAFVNQWQGRIFNLHPSLLPQYPGRDSIEKSYYEGAQMGVTVHEVITEMDAGDPLLQLKVGPQASGGVHAFSFADAQQRISVSEQRLVRESLRKIQGRYLWNSIQK